MMINGFNPGLSMMSPNLLNTQQNAPATTQSGWSAFQQPTVPIPMPGDALQLNSINMGLMPNFNNPLGLSSLSPSVSPSLLGVTTANNNKQSQEVPPSLSAATFGNISSFGGQLMNSMSNNWNRLGSFPLLGGISAMNPLGMQPLQGTPSIQQPAFIQNPPMRRSPQQILQNIGSGAQQALQDIGSMMKDNSGGVMGFGGGMAIATAICPFAGGAMAATGASAMANQMAQHAA